MGLITDGKILRDSLKSYEVITLPSFLNKMYKLYKFEFICEVYSKLEKLPVGSNVTIIGDFCTSKSTLIKILTVTFSHLYYEEVQLKQASNDFLNNSNSIFVENKDTLKKKY